MASFKRLSNKNNVIIRCLRLWYSTSKEKVEKQPKLAADVLKYLENDSDYSKIIEKLPRPLLRKYKTPESMYLINTTTAKEIAETVRNHINEESPIVEVNPGLGFLSKELLQCTKNHLYLYETSSHFTQHLEALQREKNKRLTYKVADFFGMWKLAFQDKMDGGNRLSELLGDLASHDKSRIINIVGAMPGLNFVKHLIFNIVFHNDTDQLGRTDLFITMPAHHYRYLTDNDIQERKFKTIPALFQTFFDCKVLIKVPKVHFLPWTYPPSGKKAALMDEYCLYLVNITQKEKLPCPADYLPLLWYFFKPHICSKTTKVIPMLEQWIPGCGVWLITGQDPPDSNKSLGPNNEDAPLPHMTIFTEFGDLNLKQKITVFKRFISWPEFEQCPFRVTMESNLPKSISQIEDDDKRRMSTHIDDIDVSDGETDEHEK
ncbi:PREDICTED: dimethyladenosine transferase 2, mitochondrial [Papilio xuthus]|uniref:rRNA adenine N(6)-methyltransferase n=1 Tax=Papilio xuthus TaxID=66420 RepID=A0AAJ6ZEI6_PAPXU|nr:PREDICTED: dimethyladenosine transferase 2, mitochondrial [Papilio xuthus]